MIQITVTAILYCLQIIEGRPAKAEKEMNNGNVLRIASGRAHGESLNRKQRPDSHHSFLAGWRLPILTHHHRQPFVTSNVCVRKVLAATR